MARRRRKSAPPESTVVTVELIGPGEGLNPSEAQVRSVALDAARQLESVYKQVFTVGDVTIENR